MTTTTTTTATPDYTPGQEVWIHPVDGGFAVSACVKLRWDDMFSRVVHPMIFATRSAASDFVVKVKARRSIDLNIWKVG